MRSNPPMEITNLQTCRKKYGVLYMDPPWLFNTWSKKGEVKAPQSHYACLSFKELEKLSISNVTLEDCALFLWVIDPLLPQALRLIEAWGFKYKTVAFYWVKLNKRAIANRFDYFMGLGFWTRGNPEQCLLATRGSPKPLTRKIRKLIVEPVREHSRKPDCVRSYIEKLVDGPYLELFARQSGIPNWDCFGNELTNQTQNSLFN